MQNYYMTVTLVYPRKGRKYRRGDDIMEKYIITVQDTETHREDNIIEQYGLIPQKNNVTVKAELSLCIGDKQAERSVHYEFENDEHIKEKELIEFIEYIKNNYGLHKRHTALLSPDNYGKVFVRIDSNEYLFTRDNPDLEKLLSVIHYGYRRTMLVKEKLALLQSDKSKEPSTKGISPEKSNSILHKFIKEITNNGDHNGK